MKAVLDLKDFCTKAPHTDEKDYNELFYRYNIVDDNDVVNAVVWFAQKVDSGNIYTVSVSILNPELREEFQIFVQCDTPRDAYYPGKFQISCWSKRLDIDNFYQYKYSLDKGYEIANCIMTIFNLPEHLNPYKEVHK